MSESKIVSAEIKPWRAEDLRTRALSQLDEPEMVTIEVPIEIPGIFVPRFISTDPVVMTQESLDHAYARAKSLVEGMKNLPWTPESGELLTMAFAILHYHKPSGD